MKKLLFSIALILGLGSTAFAQQDILKSSSSYPCMFLMIDSGDHVTGKTGLSPTVTISKSGGSFASPSGSVTEISSGWYKVAGNATDSNTDGPLLLHATGSGADPTDTICGTVVEFDPRAATTLQNIVDAVLNEATSGHTTSGTVSKAIIDIGAKTTQLTFTTSNQVDATTKSISSNAITAASIATDADTEIRNSSAVIQKSTARMIAFKMVNATTGAAMTSGTPTCTRAIDSTTFSSTTSSPSAMSALGFSTLTLSTSDTNATSFTIVRCTLALANDYNNIFFIN